MSFKRSLNKTSNSGIQYVDRISGIKPWINGQYFTSFGLRQLDELVGGGNALGTLCVLEEDQYSNHGAVLYNYSIAEALSHGHPILIVSFDKKSVTERMESLPYNLNYKCNNTENNTICGEINSKIDFVDKLVEEMDNVNMSDVADTVENKLPAPPNSNSPAIIHSKDTTGVVYCNSFDLARKLQPVLFQSSFINSTKNAVKCLLIKQDDAILDDKLYYLEQSIAHVVAQVRKFVTLHGKTYCGHIFIPRLDIFINRHDGYSETDTNNYTSKAISKMILVLKRLVHGTKVSLLVSYQPHCLDHVNSNTMSNTNMSAIVTSLADTWITIESFAGKESQVPSDFKQYCGYLHIRRIQQVYCIAPSHRLSNCRFGIKRDRRKLHIESLNLPPEESRAMKSSNAINTRTISSHNNAGSSSGKGGNMTCHPGTASKLDF